MVSFDVQTGIRIVFILSTSVTFLYTYNMNPIEYLNNKSTIYVKIIKH